MTHRIFIEGLSAGLEAGNEVLVEGAEAEHARKVKRVALGARVELLDGRGRVVDAEVTDARRSLVLRVAGVRTASTVQPRLEVWGATPKGGRVDQMIDGLAEVGAAGWRPLATEWGVVDPGDTKLARLERLAREASKQCGRAWLLEMGQRATMQEALSPAPGTRIIMADASGAWHEPDGSSAIRLLIGPEGGWTARERADAQAAGASLVRFGVHTMRIEVAAVISAGVIMNAEQRARASV